MSTDASTPDRPAARPTLRVLDQQVVGAGAGAMLYRVAVSERLDRVAAADWDRLLEADDRPLLSWAYLQALEEAGCVGGTTSWQPLHLLVQRLPVTASADETDGELLAAAPAYVKYDSDGEWVYDFDWAAFAESLAIRYYPKLVLAVPYNPVGGGRLLTRPDLPADERTRLRLILLRAAKRLCQLGRLSSAHVLFPRPDPATEEALQRGGFLLRRQEQYHFLNDGYRTFDDFLGRMRGNRRTAIRRERRALREAGVTVATYRGLADNERPATSDGPRPFTRQELDEMFELYLATSLRYTGSAPYLNRRFFHLCAERLGDRLELVLARRDGVIVGGAWNLRGDTRLFGRYWGQRDGEQIPFLHFEVCYYHSVERCIAEGLQAFEPGHGGEHKLMRGFTPVLTESAHYLREARLRRSISMFLTYEAPHVVASLRGATERYPLSPRPRSHPLPQSLDESPDDGLPEGPDDELPATPDDIHAARPAAQAATQAATQAAVQAATQDTKDDKETGRGD